MTEDEYGEIIKRYKGLTERANNYNDEITAQSFSRHRREEKEALTEIKLWKEKLNVKGANVKQYEELIRLAEKNVAISKSQREVLGRIKNEVKVTLDSFTDFVRSTAVQYNYAQQMAKQYKQITRELGANATQAKNIEKSFKGAAPEVLLMGGSLEDMTTMMETFSDENGRARALTKGELIDITAISKAINLTSSETTKMAESFDLMGMSTVDMSKHIGIVYEESQNLGLNARKVVKVLSDNMAALQSYSFSSGVKGMTQMAKQAVKMRLEVGDVLQMADKFYQPEAAIEAAANLQMLGGDIAEAFGDPFETMYLARNKPEELAKKLGDMTENMMQFNETSGQYEFPAEVRMQLKSAGEQLGINTDKMIEMARQSSKIKDIKMKFTSIGDEDKMEGLASLAKYSTEQGKFVIQHNGEELGLDQISDGMADEILKATKSERDNEGKSDSELFKAIAVNTQTMSERFKNTGESQMAKVAGQTNIYEIAAGNLEKTVLEDMTNNMNRLGDAFIKNANFEDVFSAEDMSLKGIYGEGIDNINDTIEAIKTGIVNFDDSLTKLTKVINKEASALSGKEGDTGDLVSFPGSEGRVLTGPFGSIGLDDRDLIVALDPNKVSEGGGDGKGTSSEMKVSGTATINVNINSNTAISANMESQLTSKIIEVYQKIANGGGDPSSVFQAQPSKGSEILYT